MKTQRMFATETTQRNLRYVRRLTRLAALRPSRSRLALESLEPRAMLTASPAFASCEWMDTLPQSYWMATCQAAGAPAAATVTCDEQPQCAEMVKTVSVRGGGSTVCVDFKAVCPEQEERCEQQDCTPTPSCDSASPTERRKSDCDEQPTPQQARQKTFEKIATLLRSVGVECDFDYEDCDTPSTPGASSQKQSRGNRSEPSCDDNTAKNRNERECDTQERGHYSDKSVNCRVVERCWSDRNSCDSVVPARYR